MIFVGKYSLNFSFFKSKFQVIHAKNSDLDSGFWREYENWAGYMLESGLCKMIDGCACILAQFRSHYLVALIVSYFAYNQFKV